VRRQVERNVEAVAKPVRVDRSLGLLAGPCDDAKREGQCHATKETTDRIS
jgi:hypothetical protein